MTNKLREGIDTTSLLSAMSDIAQIISKPNIMNTREELVLALNGHYKSVDHWKRFSINDDHGKLWGTSIWWQDNEILMPRIKVPEGTLIVPLPAKCGRLTSIGYELNGHHMTLHFDPYAESSVQHMFWEVMGDNVDLEHQDPPRFTMDQYKELSDYIYTTLSSWKE